VEIVLPPLRERPGDIPLLVEHFIATYAEKYNLPVRRLTADALDRLSAHPWPGNVRALSHAVERAVILASGPMLEAADFSLAAPSSRVMLPLMPDTSRLDAVERETIVRALEAHNRNVSRAAQALGLTRASLYRRMEKYGL
jgi:two-component system, NtrC family, response regulator HydG